MPESIFQTRSKAASLAKAEPPFFKRYKTVPLLYLSCDIELVEYSQKRETDSRLQGGNTYGSNFEGCRS